MIDLSRTSEHIRAQPMFKFMAMAKSLEDQGREVIHLEIGDTANFSNQHLHDILRDLADDPPMGYSPSAGDSELRSLLAERYSAEIGGDLTENNIVISPANALISQIFTVLGDPGESVLIPDPGFPTYALALESLGMKARYYPLHEDDGWNPDVGELVPMMDGPERPKAIMVNSPSNPLGSVINEATLNEIVAEAAKRNIAVIIDETYKNLVFSGGPPPVVTYGDNVIYIYSFSKDCAVPGLRMGCLVGPEHVVAKVSDHNSLFFSCQPAMFQKAITRYLRENGSYNRHIASVVADRAKAVSSILSHSNRLSFVPPMAAFYVFVDVSKIDQDGEAVATRLLNEAGVCVCPGGYFGPSGRGYIRLSMCGEEQRLLEGCQRIVDFAG